MSTCEYTSKRFDRPSVDALDSLLICRTSLRECSGLLKGICIYFCGHHLDVAIGVLYHVSFGLVEAIIELAGQ